MITWNCRRAPAKSPLWSYFESLEPDIALLQEVAGLPDRLRDAYDVCTGTPINKQGVLTSSKPICWSAAEYSMN